MKFINKFFLLIFFLSYLMVLGGLSYYNCHENAHQNKKHKEQMQGFDILEWDKNLKENYRLQEEFYNRYFYKKIFFVEKYGKLQRMLGKKLIDDSVDFRRIYQGKENMLYYVISKEGIVEDLTTHIGDFSERLNRMGIANFFVLAPNKHLKNSDSFPDGVLDYANQNADEIHQALLKRGMKILNLNDESVKEGRDEVSDFYMTDTHWKNTAVFWGYQKLLKFWEREFDFKGENSDISLDIFNYNREIFEDIYLGSMGKRAGVDYISQKDDYELLIPKFETQYHFKKYGENGELYLEKRGSFEEAFIDRKVPDSKDVYMDTYITMMGYGQAYEMITNELVKDGSKVVLIKDSFAMPLSAFLSANVSSLHLLDTRFDEIRLGLLDKIKEIQPDYVIFFFSPTSFFYFPSMFEF